MFQHLCTLLTSTAHTDLIVVVDRQLLIRNQYIFLWNVLPKITQKLIHRSKFIKELVKYEFQLMETKGEEDKTLRFTINSEECYVKMRQICRIRQEKISQKLQLDTKLNKIQSLISGIREMGEKQLENRFQLLEEISSFKEINRNLYKLQQQEINLIDRGLEPNPFMKPLNRESFAELSNIYLAISDKSKQKAGQFYSQAQISY